VLKKTMIFLGGFIVLIALVFLGVYYYQTTRFNPHVTINNIDVGGLTAEKALKQLEHATAKNIVYVGKKKIYDGKDTGMGFTNQDLSLVKQLLKDQWTLLPSFSEQNYTLVPSKGNQIQRETMKREIEEKLRILNKNLQAPKDAEVHLEQGKVVVTKSVAGGQYDVQSLLKEYQKQAANSVIQLHPVYLQPVTTGSPVLEKERKALQDLVQQSVDYKLQNKPYSFKGSEIIESASVSKDLKVTMTINMQAIKNKLNELNTSLSTLNKNYTFKTHSGQVITVKGGSYGWAINIDAEAARIKEVFAKGERSLLAYNIYGVGWNINGVGYHVTTNHGIGDTYVEISIKDQRIWIYKDGQLKVTTRVVTGRHDTNEDTPKGVWYIEYKESPSVLEGSEVGNPNYSVKVNYWAPFTLGGVGLHDASWRTNWAMDAYLHHGSGGCVNTPPSVMKTVYDNVEQYEPVIVY
jgi:hypothetical protein